MTNRTKGIIAAAVVIVALLAVGVWYFYLRDDAPEAVNLEAATEQLTSTTADGGDGAGTGSTDTTQAAPAGIEGTWVVDNESGDFNLETATGSFAGFRVEEELASIGATTAVGRTDDVTGSITITGNTLESADLEVDLTQIVTDQSRRDSRVQDALETEQFPTATFVLTEPIDLGPGAAEGDAVSVDATGDLTIHGVTNAVTVALEAQLVDGTSVVIGSIPIVFSDFGVEAPTAPVVLSVSDEGTVEFQLLFAR